MKWVSRSPVFGDMIRVRAGQIYHFGIYASDEEVIQFGLAPIARPNVPDRDVEVCVSNIAAFCCGNELEVGECDTDMERKVRRTPEQTVGSARERIGEKNYSIIHNNCEHFAYKCATGSPFCSQTLNVREMFRAFPIVDLYIIKEREDERALLEYAINRSFGKKPQDAALECVDGAWRSSACKIAVARGCGALVMCISRADVSLELDGIADGDEYGARDGVWIGKITLDGISFKAKIHTATPERVRTYTNINL